jgi:arabinofuranosyltransferase
MSSESLAATDANGGLLSSIRARWHCILQVAVLAMPLVLLTVVGWAHRWIFDDGFIYLRVVRQLRVGHGPVFNTGQRVEVFTSPLWVGVLAVADLITPLRLEWLAVVLGIGASVLGAGCAMIGSVRLARLDAPREFLLPLGVVVFAVLVPVWYFESAGLETGLTFAWLGICWWALARWAVVSQRRLSVPASIALGLGWLVRPELVVDSAVFLIVVSVVQWRDASWRQRVGTVAWMIAVPAAYEIFRMGYYGSLVANTAIAKEGSRLRVGTGWSYLMDFVQPYWLWLPVALLLFGVYLPLVMRLRRRGEAKAVWALVAFVVAGFGNAAAVVSFGGDYVHGRLLLPALFALCAPIAVVPATKRYVTALAVFGWALVCAISLRPAEYRKPSGFFFRDGVTYGMPRGNGGRIALADLGWGPHSPLRAPFESPTVYVADTTHGFNVNYVQVHGALKPGLRLPLIVMGAIGLRGYALGPRVSVLDLNGLADAFTGHLALVRRGQTGHEKVLPAAWVAARVTADGSQPRAQDFPLEPSVTTPPASDLSFLSQVAWARIALRCPAIADLQRSTERPLTVGAFVSNIIHSFDHTSLRIPSNPQQAAERFCPADRLAAERFIPTGPPFHVLQSLTATEIRDAHLTSWKSSLTTRLDQTRVVLGASQTGAHRPRDVAARAPPTMGCPVEQFGACKWPGPASIR